MEAPCVGNEAHAVSADVWVGLERALRSFELGCLLNCGDCVVDGFLEYHSVSGFTSGVVV